MGPACSPRIPNFPSGGGGRHWLPLLLPGLANQRPEEPCTAQPPETEELVLAGALPSLCRQGTETMAWLPPRDYSLATIVQPFGAAPPSSAAQRAPTRLEGGGAGEPAASSTRSVEEEDTASVGCVTAAGERFLDGSQVAVSVPHGRSDAHSCWQGWGSCE